MRAFFYTLVLSLVLVASVVVLYRTDAGRSVHRSGGFDLEPVASRRPLPLASLSGEELERYGLEELYATGIEFMDRWHVPEAKEIFENVAEKDSLRQEVFLKLAECSSDPMLRNEEETAEYLERAASLPGKDEAYTSALREIFLQGDYDKASEGLKRFLRKEPRDMDAVYFLARALFERGKIRDAEKQIEILLREDETHGKGRELLINCLMAEGKVEEAEGIAKDLAGIYPGEPYPYVLLTFLEIVKGDVEAAREFCNNAVNLDPRYVPAIFAEGYLYSVEGNLEAALVSFEKLLLFDNPFLEASARDAVAYIRFLSGDFDEAVDEIDEAVRLLISSGSRIRAYGYLFRLVDYLCELGQGKSAEEILKKWTPEMEKIPFQLAKLRIEISDGEMENAKHVLTEIENRAEWRRWMRLIGANYGELAALTMLREEDFKNAMKVLSGSPGILLSPVRAGYLHGYAAFESGDAEKAKGYFETVLRQRFKPWFPYHEDPILWVQSLFYLAESNVARGDIERAKGYYEKFISYWQDAAWELEAVDHAEKKLETLSSSIEGDKK